MNKPLYKEAYELAAEYKKKGIKYCYNQRNKTVYLSLLNAPSVAEGVTGCQLTGWLEVSGGVIASRNINRYIERVKTEYARTWKDNPAMMRYLTC
jgi:hypothetical protein